MEELLKQIEQEADKLAQRKQEVDNMPEVSENTEQLNQEIEQLKQQLNGMTSEKNEIEQKMQVLDNDQEANVYQDMVSKREQIVTKAIDITKQMAQKRGQIQTENKEQIEAKQESTKQLQEEMEQAKQRLLAEIQAKKSFLDNHIDIDQKIEEEEKHQEEINQEKVKIEKQIALSNISKEDYDNMDEKQKNEVLIAKQQFLENKNKLEQLNKEPEYLKSLYGQKKQVEELLDGKSLEQQCMNFSELAKLVDKQFSIENIEKYQHITTLLGEEANENTNGNNELNTEANNNGPIKPDPIQSKPKSKIYPGTEPNPQLQPHSKFKSAFLIVTSHKTLYHLNTKEDKQITQIDIQEAVENRKEILKQAHVEELLTGNKLHKMLMMRKLDPAIVKTIQENGDRQMLKAYVDGIAEHVELPFQLKYNLKQSALDSKTGREVRRYARAAGKIPGVEVEKDSWIKRMFQKVPLLGEGIEAEKIEDSAKTEKVEESKAEEPKLKDRVEISNQNNEIEQEALLRRESLKEKAKRLVEQDRDDRS